MNEPDHDILRRGQFVLGPRPLERFASWNHCEVGPGLHLAAHPALDVTQTVRDGMRLTLIGFIVDPDDPAKSDAEILEKMARAVRPGIPPVELTGRFGGRWLLIIAEPDDIRIFGDPAGLRQMFHTGAEAPDGMWAASEPGILAEIHGFGISPEARDFMASEEYILNDEHWWPWDTSPYREIRRLPPNHELCVRDGLVRRFWPDKGFAPSSPGDAAEVVCGTLRGLIEAMHARCPIAINLTAGLDSRMVLAAAKPVAHDVLFVTSKKRGMPDIDPDLVIASRLAANLGLQHQIIDSDCPLRPEFRDLYFSSNRLSHEKWVYGAQAIHDALNLEKVGVSGHVAEIARSNFMGYKSGLDGRASFTPEALARATGLGMQPLVVRAMERWMDGLGEIHNYDARDLLYWENRLGSWLASSQQEFLLAWNKIFAPFNCRRVLEAALSVDPGLRGEPDYPFFLTVISKLWPECMDEPINPKPPVPWTRRVRRGVGKIARKLLK